MSIFKKILIRVIDITIVIAFIWFGFYFHNLYQMEHLGSSDLLERIFVLSADTHETVVNSLSDFLLYPPIPQKKVLFVGDIMLGRGVAKLRKENGSDYPFKKINSFLQHPDLTIGNLEGPIVKKVPKLSPHSLVFAFDTSSAENLSEAGFDLVSLANNHTLNMKKEGLKETRSFLKQVGIQPFGDPLECSPNFIAVKDDIVFSGFNKTFSNGCPDEDIIKSLKSIREKYPHKFIVVVMHWGEEYHDKNTVGQKELAHKIINAGADLIIGSHPHVVEGVEKYKGRMIFYSLGNFVFDQYFSKDVQQELGVEAIFYPSYVLYRLWPIQSKLSQPYLMSTASSSIFLEKVAQDSEDNLTEQIRRGIIENRF